MIQEKFSHQFRNEYFKLEFQYLITGKINHFFKNIFFHLASSL